MVKMRQKKLQRELIIGSLLVVTLVLLVAALLLAGCGCGKEAVEKITNAKKLTTGDVKLEHSDLGEGWRLDKEFEVDLSGVDPESTIGLIKEMGAVVILNQIFTRDGEKLQVNFVQMQTDEDARDVAELLTAELEGSGNVFGTKKNIAVEIISTNSSIKNKVVEILDLEVFSEGTGEDRQEGKAKVTFEFACVDVIDYMKTNDLSNYIENYQEGQPVNPEMQTVINGAVFGNTITLLTESGDNLKADYSFEPAAIGKQRQDGTTTFMFEKEELLQKLGVPFVKVKGELEVGSSDIENGDGTKLDSEEKAKYLGETRFWPVSQSEVQRISNQIAGTLEDDAKKVEAIWQWVRDNIEYSGPPGTRYGTLQVISQGYGRCWDKSDVFVTLCRAAGVPAREVAGWLADDSTGHVWAEAYLEGKGWIGVDTTNDRVGTDSGYLPFFATADGEMPILYINMPKVEEQ